MDQLLGIIDDLIRTKTAKKRLASDLGETRFDPPKSFMSKGLLLTNTRLSMGCLNKLYMYMHHCSGYVHVH